MCQSSTSRLTVRTEKNSRLDPILRPFWVLYVTTKTEAYECQPGTEAASKYNQIPNHPCALEECWNANGYSVVRGFEMYSMRISQTKDPDGPFLRILLSVQYALWRRHKF